MGKQSSRLVFDGHDHKDIYYQGNYHDKMYIGNQLVWEKMADGGEGERKYWDRVAFDEEYIFRDKYDTKDKEYNKPILFSYTEHGSLFIFRGQGNMLYSLYDGKLHGPMEIPIWGSISMQGNFTPAGYGYTKNYFWYSIPEYVLAEKAPSGDYANDKYSFRCELHFLDYQLNDAVYVFDRPDLKFKTGAYIVYPQFRIGIVMYEWYQYIAFGGDKTYHMFDDRALPFIMELEPTDKIRTDENSLEEIKRTDKDGYIYWSGFRDGKPRIMRTDKKKSPYRSEILCDLYEEYNIQGHYWEIEDINQTDFRKYHRYHFSSAGPGSSGYMPSCNFIFDIEKKQLVELSNGRIAYVTKNIEGGPPFNWQPMQYLVGSEFISFIYEKGTGTLQSCARLKIINNKLQIRLASTEEKEMQYTTELDEYFHQFVNSGDKVMDYIIKTGESTFLMGGYYGSSRAGEYYLKKVTVRPV